MCACESARAAANSISASRAVMCRRPSGRFAVEEAGLEFLVNLDDYLDTGLFLDHRLTRARAAQSTRTGRDF